MIKIEMSWLMENLFKCFQNEYSPFGYNCKIVAQNLWDLLINEGKKWFYFKYNNINNNNDNNNGDNKDNEKIEEFQIEIPYNLKNLLENE
jgi:hypothetical protein